jgi:hypothetical protein
VRRTLCQLYWWSTGSRFRGAGQVAASYMWVVTVRAVPGREQAADPGDSGQSEPGKAERVCHVRF